MTITAMTATFGTLRNASMKLKPGMNLRTLPNEAGKSTWAAFLTAMFYGIPTNERTSKNGIPAKTRYQPWSGEPMEGTLELIWQDRPVRITRTSGPQGPMAEFRAIWQDSGEPIAGMTGDNCGKMLLGIDRAVYVRSALISQSHLAVSQSPELEERLGALVTSGDTSTSYSRVKRTLKDWQNQRQYHKSGRLPEAIARRDALAAQLADASATQEVTAAGSEELEELAQQRQVLAEQLKAASGAAGLEGPVAEALEEMQRTERTAAALREQVLPPLHEIDQLLQDLDTIERDAQELAARPRTADGVTGSVQLAVFNGMTAEQAAEKANADVEAYRKLHRAAIWEKLSPVLSIAALLLAIVSMLLLRVTFAYIVGAMLIVFGAANLLLCALNARNSAQSRADAILASYGADDEAGIYAAAEAYVQAPASTAMPGYDTNKLELSRRVSAIRKAVAPLGRADSIRGCRDTLQAARLRRIKLDHAEDDARQAKALYERLLAASDSTQPGQVESTEQKLAALDNRISQLRSSVSMEQGRTAALGTPAQLQRQLAETDAEIAALQTELKALELAQSAMADASEELQTRVFPQLTEPASRYIRRMTSGKYDQVIVDRELNISARADNASMDRQLRQLSTGTADQLYLALRLAICDAALPADAPILLDDALLSFDEERLSQAMHLLHEISQQRQILLFSCTGREVRWNQRHSASV